MRAPAGTTKYGGVVYQIQPVKSCPSVEYSIKAEPSLHANRVKDEKIRMFAVNFER